MVARPLALAWLVGVFVSGGVGEGRAEPLPDAVFRPWDGEWTGEFLIYSPRGEKRVVRVRHVYTSVDDTRQEGTIEDVLPDGTTVRKRAVNTVEDGRLLCRVYREDGSLEVEHEGVWVDGSILWSSTDDDGRIRQVFRERVSGGTYAIDGVGIYGPKREVVEIYVGRYRRATQPER